MTQLDEMELFTLKTLVDRFLDAHGDKMEQEVPVGYLALKSVQIKLHRIKPVKAQRSTL